MLRTQSEFKSSASAISASPRLRGFETGLTRTEKNPELAERLNAEKWVQDLSAFDFSALTDLAVMTLRLVPATRRNPIFARASTASVDDTVYNKPGFRNKVSTMTKIVQLEVAQATLGELIAGLKPHEEIEIVQNEKPIDRIVLPNSGRPHFGNCNGMLTIVSEDNEHLKAFEEQMP